jgi:hypothetical protein
MNRTRNRRMHSTSVSPATSHYSPFFFPLLDLLQDGAGSLGMGFDEVESGRRTTSEVAWTDTAKVGRTAVAQV